MSGGVVQVRTSGGDSEAQLANHVTPTVDAERCVHGRSPIAQCRACVVACPVAAFVLEDEGLTFDEDRCDGCALCAAACPEQAIDVGSAISPLVSPPVDAERAFMACEKVGAFGEPGMVTCLHAVSTAALTRLHARGIGVLVVAQVDCAGCSRNYGLTLTDHLSHLTRLTSDRGLPPLLVRQVDAATWRDERDDAGRMTRRTLFRAALGGRPAHRTADDASPADAPIGVAAPDLLLGARDRATIASFSPIIDQATCVACGVCVEVCEHDALRMADREGDGARYEIDGTRCTGCALCVDGCEPGAIVLSAWGAARPVPVALVKGKCRRCSSPFHAVARAAVDTSLCRICATKSHHHKLFQVLP